MKSTCLFAFGTLSILSLAIVSWSTWPATARAQNIAQPVPAKPIAESEKRPPEKKPRPAWITPVPKTRAKPVDTYNPSTNTSSRTDQRSVPSIDLLKPADQYGKPASLRPGGAGAWPPSSLVNGKADHKTQELARAYLERRNEVNELVKKYEANEGANKNETIRKKIAEVTAIQFDLRQQMRELEVAKLRQRLSDVESSVAKRNELKNQIVEKRVADILREPDQLQWDGIPHLAPPPNRQSYVPSPGKGPILDDAPTSPKYQTATPNGTVQIPNAVPYDPQRSAVPAEAANGVRWVPTKQWRSVYETTVDAAGKLIRVARPVETIVYRAVNGDDSEQPLEPRAQGEDPFAGQSPAPASSPPYQFSDAPTRPQANLATRVTLAEAEAMLRLAKRKRQLIRELKFEGLDAEQRRAKELLDLDADVELSELTLAKVRVEYEGELKLQELRVREANRIFELVHAKYQEMLEINKRTPNAIPSGQLTIAKADRDVAQIRIGEAQAVLELLKKRNQLETDSDEEATLR